MVYGITGNTGKPELWQAVSNLVAWLRGRDLPFCLHDAVAGGLAERGLVGAAICTGHAVAHLAGNADLVLSFGGDGTLLKTAHDVGTVGTPILGINIGRLGFLADVEVGQLYECVQRLEEGAYRVEARLVLTASIDHEAHPGPRWALNEFAITRSGPAGLIAIDVAIDGHPLNTYWADGLIMATPTGSTAYSMAAGGPIVVPGAEVITLTPLAPHTLTVRPIVLPNKCTVTLRVYTRGQPYVLGADGTSTIIHDEGVEITVERASYTVNLVKLLDRHYFQTLRSKLMWGVRAPF